MREAKVYLGDGAYAAFDGETITITAEDGIRATDTVCLDPEALKELLHFVEHLKKQGAKL